MGTKYIYTLLFIVLFAGLVIAPGPKSVAEGQMINQLDYEVTSAYSKDVLTVPLWGTTLEDPKRFITQKDQNKPMGIFDQLPGNLGGMIGLFGGTGFYEFGGINMLGPQPEPPDLPFSGGMMSGFPGSFGITDPSAIGYIGQNSLQGRGFSGGFVMAPYNILWPAWGTQHTSAFDPTNYLGTALLGVGSAYMGMGSGYMGQYGVSNRYGLTGIGAGSFSFDFSSLTSTLYSSRPSGLFYQFVDNVIR